VSPGRLGRGWGFRVGFRAASRLRFFALGLWGEGSGLALVNRRQEDSAQRLASLLVGSRVLGCSRLVSASLPVTNPRQLCISDEDSAQRSTRQPCYQGDTLSVECANSSIALVDCLSVVIAACLAYP